MIMIAVYPGAWSTGAVQQVVSGTRREQWIFVARLRLLAEDGADPADVLLDTWERTLASTSFDVAEQDQEAPEAVRAAFYGAPDTAIEAALALRVALLEMRRPGDAVPPEVRLGVRRTAQNETDQEAVRMAASLARGAEPDELVVDRVSAAGVGTRLLVRQEFDRGELSVLGLKPATSSDRADGGSHGPASRESWRDKLGLASNVVTAVAGLAAWVAVLGGVTMWARLDGANVPVREGIAALPRGVLITEGLLTLLLPLLVGSAAAFLVYSSPRGDNGIWARFLDAVKHKSGWIALIPACLLFAYLRWGVDLTLWAIILMLALAFVVLALLLLFLANSDSRTASTAVAFSALVLWTGVLGYAREAWSTGARLEPATVQRSAGIPVTGLFVAHTNEAVFVAVDSKGNDCDLLVIPTREIRELRVGHRNPRPTCSSDDAKQGPSAGPSVTVTETVTVPEVVTVPNLVTVPKVVTVPKIVTVPETKTVTVVQPVPAGAIDLGDKISIPVASVNLPARLEIYSVKFTPDPLRVRKALHVTVEVRDTRNYVIRGALVLIRDTPGLDFTPPPEQRTGQDGRAKLRLEPRNTLVLGKHEEVAIFVRARKPGERLTAGVSGRLVQFHVR